MDRTGNIRKAIWKRIGTVMLSLVVTVTMMPLFAFAADEPAAGGVSAEDSGFEEVFCDTSDDIGDPDSLLEQYIDKQAGADSGSSEEVSGGETLLRSKAKAARRTSALSAYDMPMYSELAAGIRKIAEGRTRNSYVKITTYNRGVNFPLIVHALIADMPYELYWYDKTEGCLIRQEDSGEIRVYFAVCKEYRGTYHGTVGNIGLKWYDLNGNTALINDSIQYARDYVSQCRGLKDLDKLRAYKTRICSLTSYNAAAISDGEEYGDPWQLIYVFDGDPSTNVVCEGYAKAFQFLCNLSDFDSDSTECYTVTGKFTGQSSGGHMWNILHMDDGKNYIADLTNCDSGTVGEPDMLFLRGCLSGSVSYGYLFYPGVMYEYDNETLELYYSDELTLADEDYNEKSEKVGHVKAVNATCTAAGNIEYWTKGGRYFIDAYCTAEITGQETVIAPLGHSWVVTASTLDHDSYACSRCGAATTASRVVTDRPKVTIRKPAKAKASITVKWKKLSKKKRSKVSGIEIQYSRTKDFSSAYKVTKAGKKATSKKIKKLARKKTYYVRIRTYKWINGRKHVSAWSSVKKIRTR